MDTMKTIAISLISIVIGWIGNGYFGLSNKVDDIDSRLVKVETILERIEDKLDN